jgi:UDP-N-acetylglucosamine--N-acetylmuramyl-(pentapeptide) pyrophosphoryl-undecaprenol N-acetylglucosamine transferase
MHAPTDPPAAWHAARIAVAFDSARDLFPKKVQDRIARIGIPIRREVAFVDAEGAVQELGLERDLPTLLVLGGSSGSARINETVLEALPDLVSFANVIHQTGNSVSIPDYAEGKKLEERIKGTYAGSYTVFDYVQSDMIGDVFASADVVVSRAGVNTVTELLALGKKAVLIPIPKTSHDEQCTNARYWETMGLGTMLEQSNLTPHTLIKEVEELVECSLSSEVISRARAAIRLDASDRLAETILSEL